MHLTTRVTLARSVALALVLWLVLLLETGNAASVPSGMRGTGLAGAPAGLVAAIDRSAQREAALDPAFRVDAQGCARLSAQHMTACFTPGGARFSTPRAALQLSLSAWGRPGRLTALALAPGRPHANRIEYRGSGIRAWWRVLPLGYEQGFTVERAPAGRGPVIIELRASRAPAIAGDSLAWGRLHYGQLVVTDARGRVLPATLTAVGRKVVLRFDAARARYPLNVDPLVWVEQEVTARDGAVGDNFGYSVAVSGSTALVGAPYHQVGSNANQGVAYVYTEANGVWSQTAELTASDGAAQDQFGWSVALNGTTALVGARYHKVGNNAYQGAAYVYTEANGVWSQMAELTASDGAGDDLFGWSVALNGATALVGALYHQVGSNNQQGAAYVYTEANGTWSQTAELTASDGAAYDHFGYSVAVSGPTALVGALYHQVGSNADQGTAYVYTETTGVWSQTAELTASDGAGYDNFGKSVALNGATALVGAQGHQVGSNVRQGAAYVYTDTNGVWSQTAELTASDGAANDVFGGAVALNGATALVGAPYHQVGSNVNQGAAYVYTEANGTWSQTAELTASDGAANNYFGASVAVSGSTALVGAPSHTVGGNVGQGAAYVYTEANGAWSQTAELTASDGAANNDFGLSVALSGATALVGAPGHTVNGNVSQGAAYVYTEANGTWSQTAELTASDGAQGNFFGWSVAVSGATALVGADSRTVGGNTSQGAAYVYTEANGAWSQTAELTASDGATSDYFGSSVALNGPTALVGAPGHTVNGNVSQGAAYVYTETNGTWSQTAELTASDGATNNDFGSSVALSGATALVGAPYHTVGGNADRGAAYFFGSADLGLVLSTPAEVAPGADYTSQAILTNSSSTASPALSVLLPVPTGTNYVSSSATQGSCSQAAGTVTCNLGSLAASGGSTSGSVTLQATAAAGTALANSASLALSTPALSQTSTTTVAVTPAVTGLANASVTIGQNVPVESFTISGTGALTVTASSSNTTLLPNAGLNVSSGCNANGAKCTLSITPAVGQTGTATVTVTVMDVHGGQGSGSFTLTVSGLPPPPPSSGGGGALDCWSLLGLLLALLLPIRRRFRPGSNPAPS